jgi:hypothetical protein
MSYNRLGRESAKAIPLTDGGYLYVPNDKVFIVGKIAELSLLLGESKIQIENRIKYGLENAFGFSLPNGFVLQASELAGAIQTAKPHKAVNAPVNEICKRIEEWAKLLRGAKNLAKK